MKHPARALIGVLIPVLLWLPGCTLDTAETGGRTQTGTQDPTSEPSGSGGGGGGNGGSAEPEVNSQVTRVIDGDTIEVTFKGESFDVRLIGVDTPETVHPSEPVECFGVAASHFTERMIDGEQVRLEFDVERLDRYGRTLAYVWLGDQLFNEMLVRQGFAQVSTYPPNVEYVDRFLAAQRAAKKNGRGLWGRCDSENGGAGGSGSEDGGGEPGCTSGYSPCLPPASDYDCAGGSGDGPEYTGRVTVTGSDPYDLDDDDDGVGCESS